ncbi:MAG: DoxX family protein [Patescibacteria group bacterium]
MKLNFRNKWLVIVVRTLLGLMFVFSGISGLMAGMNNMQGVPAEMIPASMALWSMGIFQMIKVTEIVAGIMFITGFLPALAAIFVAPICIGVIVFDSQVGPQYLPSGIIISAMNMFMGYAYWDKFKSLFVRK